MLEAGLPVFYHFKVTFFKVLFIFPLTRLTCMVFSQFFSLLMPALLITMSRRPNLSTVAWNASVQRKNTKPSYYYRTVRLLIFVALAER